MPSFHHISTVVNLIVGEEPVLSCKNFWPDPIYFTNKIFLNYVHTISEEIATKSVVVAYEDSYV